MGGRGRDSGGGVSWFLFGNLIVLEVCILDYVGVLGHVLGC